MSGATRTTALAATVLLVFSVFLVPLTGAGHGPSPEDDPFFGAFSEANVAGVIAVHTDGSDAEENGPVAATFLISNSEDHDAAVAPLDIHFSLTGSDSLGDYYTASSPETGSALTFNGDGTGIVTMVGGSHQVSIVITPVNDADTISEEVTLTLDPDPAGTGMGYMVSPFSESATITIVDAEAGPVAVFADFDLSAPYALERDANGDVEVTGTLYTSADGTLFTNVGESADGVKVFLQRDCGGLYEPPVDTVCDGAGYDAGTDATLEADSASTDPSGVLTATFLSSDLDDLLAGDPAAFLNLFVQHPEFGGQAASFNAAADALFDPTDGGDAAELQQTTFTPVVLAASTSGPLVEGDGFVAQVTFPGAAPSDGAILLAPGQDLVAEVTALTTDNQDSYEPTEGLNVNLAVEVSCGSLEPVINPAGNIITDGDNVCSSGTDLVIVRSGTSTTDANGQATLTITAEELAAELFTAGVPTTFVQIMIVDVQPDATNRVSHYYSAAQALAASAENGDDPALASADLMDDGQVTFQPILLAVPDSGDAGDGYALFIEPEGAVATQQQALVLSATETETFDFTFYANSYDETGMATKVPITSDTPVAFALLNQDFLPTFDPTASVASQCAAGNEGCVFLADGSNNPATIARNVDDDTVTVSVPAGVVPPGAYVAWAFINADDSRDWLGQTDIQPVSGYHSVVRNSLAATPAADFLDYHFTPLVVAPAQAGPVSQDYLYIDTPNAHTPDCEDAFPMDIVCRLMYATQIVQNMDDYGAITPTDGTVAFFALPYTSSGEASADDVDTIRFYAVADKTPAGTPGDGLITGDGEELGEGVLIETWNVPDGAYVLAFSVPELAAALQPLFPDAVAGDDVTFYVYAIAEDDDGPIDGKEGAYSWEKSVAHLNGASAAAVAANDVASPLVFTMPEISFSVDGPSDPQFLQFDASATYTFTVTNEGGVDDSYALDLSGAAGDWIVGTLSATSVDVAAGESADVTVAVTAPAEPADETVIADLDLTFMATSGASGESESHEFSVKATDDAIVIQETDGSTVVAEGSGVTDSYTVRLTSAPDPTAPVIIWANSDGEYILTSPTGDEDGDDVLLTFTATTFNHPQTVIVEAVDDDETDDGPRDANGFSFYEAVIRHQGFQAGDPAPYDEISLDLIGTIEDNDVPGLGIFEAGGVTAIAEGGPGDEYVLMLDSDDTPPIGPVEVLICPGPQVIVDASGVDGAIDHSSLPASPPSCETIGGESQTAAWSIVFTPADWDAPRTILVEAVDDDVYEGEDLHTGLVHHQVATTADERFAGLKARLVEAEITDNDEAGVVVSPVELEVLEEGETEATYTVVLETEPTGTVTVTPALNPTGQIDMDPTSLTFTADDWDTPQTVTVTAVDDGEEEGEHSVQVTHTVAQADGLQEYDGFDADDVAVVIEDNDEIALLIDTDDGLAVAEEETTDDSYTIRLGSQPAGDVTVTITPDDQVTIDVAGEGTAGPDADGAWTVVFTDGNWNDWRTVTVTAVDDSFAEDDPHNGIITHDVSSGDGDYDALDAVEVTVEVADNDAAALAFTGEDDLTVSEEGTTDDLYTIALASEPTADVTVTVTPDDQVTIATSDSRVSESEGVLTIGFTANDWDDPVEITVTAIDDQLAEDDTHEAIITHDVSSGDGDYDALDAVDVTVEVADNDGANILAIHAGDDDSETRVAEAGGEDEYTIRLASLPTSDVTVTVDPGAEVQIDEITVPDEGDSGATPNGDGTWTIVFTPDDFDVVRTVTVSAVDDEEDEEFEEEVAISHVASQPDGDGEYDGVSADLTVTVEDNDGKQIVVTETGDSTEVTEGSDTDSFDVALTEMPTGTVVVQVSVVDDPPQTTINSGDGTQVSDTVIEFVFTPLDFDTARTVTVAAVDDGVSESDADETHPSLIRAEVVAETTDEEDVASTTDEEYLDAVPMHVDVAVTDDDVVAVLLSKTELSVSEDGETSETYTVRLGSKPTAPVAVTVHPPETANGQQVTLTDGEGNSNDDGTVTFAFGFSSFKDPRTVVVTAFDDDVTEDPVHTATVTHTASSIDSQYDGIDILDVTVDIADNDEVVVSVVASDPAEVAEDSTDPATFTVSRTGPLADPLEVFYSLGGTAEDGTDYMIDSTTSVTIPADEGSVDVEITPIDNDVDDGDRTVIIALVPDSVEPDKYTVHSDDAEATLTIVDDDVTGVTVTESDGSTEVSEGGDTDSYELVLDSEPAGDVTITVTPDDQVEVDLTGEAGANPILDDNGDPTGAWTLTFTPDDWDAPRTVAVSAVDDEDAEEDPHTGTITHDASSDDDSLYAEAAVADVSASIAENDEASLPTCDRDQEAHVCEEEADGPITQFLPIGGIRITVGGFSTVL